MSFKKRKYVCGDCGEHITFTNIKLHGVRCRNTTYSCLKCYRTFTDISVHLVHTCDPYPIPDTPIQTINNSSTDNNPKPETPIQTTINQASDYDPKPETPIQTTINQTSDYDPKPETPIQTTINQASDNQIPSKPDIALHRPIKKARQKKAKPKLSLQPIKEASSDNNPKPETPIQNIVNKASEYKFNYKGYIQWQDYDWGSKTKRFIDSKGGSVGYEELQNFVIEDILTGLNSQVEKYFVEMLKNDTALLLTYKK